MNDKVLEHQERFIVNLEPLPGHEEIIELVDTVKVVDIIDDDSESFNLTFMVVIIQCIFIEIEIDITGRDVVVEGQDRNLTVCLTIMKPTVMCPTHEPFSMIVYTSNGSASKFIYRIGFTRLLF